MKQKLFLVLVALFSVLGVWADGIQKYTPTNRVTELQDGHSYIVYFAGLPSGQDRTGVVYERGGDQVGFYCSKKPHNGFNTTSTRFLWTVTAASDANGYYLQNVGTSKYVGSDGRANKDAASKPEVYIYQWKADGVESAGVDVESATGTRVASASSTFENENVWIVKNNASEYWHANIGAFTTWSSGHPVAFYEFSVENVATVDYTINFAGTGTGTVKCGEEVLTNGQTYTSSKLLSSSDITVEGCNYNVVVNDINMTVTVNLYGLPKISTSSEKFYYTLKDTKGRNNYAYYNGDSQYLGINAAAGNDNRYFYFTQSAAQVALSTADYKVVSIHNIAAGNKEMTTYNSWGTTETNWYIKLSPKVTDTPDYIAVCPNGNFGSDCWNDYSDKVDKYGANDNNSAWEFAPINLLPEFTVQVQGLPTATNLAGVNVYGTNYNHGAKVVSGHRDAFFAAMTAMEVPGYTACVTGRSNDIRVAYTEKIKASDAPAGGEWAANTTWYYIQQKGNGYISTGSNYKDATGFKVNQTTKPTDDNGLWAVVEDNGTYKFYNKGAGAGSVLAFTATNDNTKASFIEIANATNSNFILEPGVQAGTWCIRINGTTNARWNNRGNYLATWTSNDSFYGGGNQGQVNGGSGNGATGSQYVFEVYEPSENIIASWNNYSGDNQTSWTQGTSEMVTANTANKTSHYYNESDFQTTDHSGSVTLRFQYGPNPNGSARLDISGVELLNADGTEVLSSDIHNGYSGNAQSNRDYTIKVPGKNTAYKLRIWTYATRNSHGTITYMNWGGNPASEFEVATAKEIVSDGVGYPKVTTEAYTKMAGLAYGSSTKDDVADAKNAYVICTDIKLPEDGKAYKLKLVTPAGSSRYITYSAGSALAFTETANDNSVYLCKVVGDKYIFITKDGNILTWMGGADGYLNGGSRNGYSNMYPAIQNDKEDWNLFTCRKQNNAADQLGLVRLSARRSGTSFSSLVCQFSNWTWSNANESPFWENTTSRKFSTGILMEEVEGITAATAGYADGVEKYSLYQTAVANNTTYAGYFGEGLGKYHYGDNRTTGYMEAVKACTTLEQERAIVPVSINQPEAGKFYRFKGLGHSIRDSKSFYMSAGNAGEPLHYTEDTDSKTIFYLTSDNSILSYSTGLYGNGVNLAQIGTKGTYTIDATPVNNTVQGSVKGIGTYRIYHGSDYLVDWANGGNLQNCNDGDNGWAAWVIEEVETLPITIATSGYTTFYSPVALTLPEDGSVKAYTASVNEDLATVLYTGVEQIPANKGVLLRGTAGEHSLTVATDIIEIENETSLKGEAFTQAYDKTANTVAGESLGDKYVYTLQSGTFKYYTGTKLTGFKAHYELQDGRNSGNVRQYTFTFGEDDPTGIAEIEGMVNKDAKVYDITGRRVSNNAKGLLIINGKKVLR